MHEMSMAMAVCDAAMRHLPSNALSRLRVVAVEVGDDAGVDPGSLEFCLDVLLKSPPFGAAAPEIQRCSGDVLRVAYLEVEDASQEN